MIYLDSCAIVKLIVQEDESEALNSWLRQRADIPVLTSKLSEVEVPRAVRRAAPGILGSVSTVLRYLHRFEINDVVRATAAAYIDPGLRSPDSIHLATAGAVISSGKKITAFITYDKRLASAAVEAGFTVAAPGAQ
ncbi:MAG: type II toxin-antitoxin system VapC family toxin [Actinomycetota bacterium]|nr:type II toxin-antitoxin system VapC family toxin [Actinomycetota bacterium]